MSLVDFDSYNGAAICWSLCWCFNVCLDYVKGFNFCVLHLRNFGLFRPFFSHLFGFELRGSIKDFESCKILVDSKVILKSELMGCCVCLQLFSAC